MVHIRYVVSGKIVGLVKRVRVPLCAQNINLLKEKQPSFWKDFWDHESWAEHLVLPNTARTIRLGLSGGIAIILLIIFGAMVFGNHEYMTPEKIPIDKADTCDMQHQTCASQFYDYNIKQ